MTRPEFDKAFFLMAEALGLKGKVPRLQVELFFEEFGKGHASDFLRACKELGMGNAGYLPKLTIFREYIAGAREMRLDQEKKKEEQEAASFFSGHAKIQNRDPIEKSLAKLNSRMIIGGVRKTAARLIPEWLANPENEQWAKAHSSKKDIGITVYDDLMGLIHHYPGDGVVEPEEAAQAQAMFEGEELEV